MKDEGPFILEWIAYHKSIGITDFLIFKNDCSDGTDHLLDHLDSLGIVRHSPNPSGVLGSPRHQPVAIRYAAQFKEFRNADWVIAMDVDEFINIHVGNGSLGELFDRLPDADAIALTHLDFGCFGIIKFSDKFVTEQMTMGQTKNPDADERRGIKTLVRKDAPVVRYSNHRPVFQESEENSPIWYNGSGRIIPKRIVRGKQKGVDCKNSYRFVLLNHYPDRSMETYLAKTAKGNFVVSGAYVGIEYWNKRNVNTEPDRSIQNKLPRAREFLADLLNDVKTQELHEQSVRLHQATIEKLKATKDNMAMLDKMANC